MYEAEWCASPYPYYMNVPFQHPPYQGMPMYQQPLQGNIGFDWVRTEEDVNRVMRILNQQHQNVFNEMQRGGMERKLADYLVRSIVTFVDNDFNEFTGNVNKKVEQAERKLQRRYQWIYDIMRIFMVSPASQNRIIDTVLRVSFENLRPVAMPRYY